jgi:hypothetical protein
MTLTLSTSCHVERRDARAIASRSRNIPSMLAAEMQIQEVLPGLSHFSGLSHFLRWWGRTSIFGRTPCSGVTTGCTGIFRLRRCMRSGFAQDHRVITGPRGWLPLASSPVPPSPICQGSVLRPCWPSPTAIPRARPCRPWREWQRPSAETQAPPGK